MQIIILKETTFEKLSKVVRHYLTYNQIQWSRFSTLVLGVSQSRLSTLLSKPKPWHTLTKRVQALYEERRGREKTLRLISSSELRVES